MISNQPNVKTSNEIGREFEQVAHCLVCGDEQQVFLFNGRDDRYDYPESFPVVKCLNCGLVYLGARPHVTRVGDLYERYYSLKYFEDSKAKQTDNWKATLKKSSLLRLYRFIKVGREDLYRQIPVRFGVRILDIGSGVSTENAHNILLQGGDWVAVEVDERKCRVLEQSGLQSFWGTLETYSETNPAPFDYIVLSQVLEHIYQPRQFLTSCKSLLRPGGRVILSSPNYDSFLREQHGQRWLHWHIPYHVAQYNLHTLTLLAESIGLRIFAFATFTPITWFFVQRRLSHGIAYHDSLLDKYGLRLLQRFLDVYLRRHHRLNKGDALVAQLEVLK
jgi:2-polyprenyl-3-methyl-5-hydroxy-6-metoxy-1,4-benzoquinol methylase